MKTSYKLSCLPTYIILFYLVYFLFYNQLKIILLVKHFFIQMHWKGR